MNPLPDFGRYESGPYASGGWQVSDARYAKGKRVVQITPDKPDGFKGCGERLAQALGGKWTHRDHGYQLSPSRAELFKRLITDGWDAQLRLTRHYLPIFIQPKTNNRLGLSEVKDLYRGDDGRIYAS